MTDFNIKVGDTSPALKAQLKDDDGDPIDLSNINAVRFHMADPRDSAVKVDAAATVTDAANGKVKYEWATGDTDTPNEYRAEFEVELSGGAIETFPNNDYLDVKIREDLA